MEEVGGRCILEQRLNPLTGQSEWVVVTLQSETDDYDDLGALKERGGSLAHTQYLDMLNDIERNRAYDKAIRKAVAQGADHVLDIGAGTGLLSMMASRAISEAAHSRQVQSDGLRENASSIGKVTACESYLPMVRLARRLLRANNIGTARLIHKRSDEMEIGIDLGSPADLLVSEILDSELLGEGLIPTLRHAHAHLLTPGARSVPHGATIYAQLVESEFLRRSCDLLGVETEVADGLWLEVSRPRGFSTAIHVDPLVNNLNLLSEPFKVFDFQFSQIPADHRERELRVPITRTGKLHALISWWDLDLDEECTITYSTAPAWTRAADVPSWRDHWRQCVWFFPKNNVTVVAGESEIIEATHDQISVKYGVRSSREREAREPGHGSTSFEFVMRPERIGILGDKDHRRVIREAVLEAVRPRESPLCLIADDSVLCTVLAAAAKPDARVIAMLPGLQVDGPRYIQAAALLNGLKSDQIEVIGKKAAYLSSSQLSGKKVDVLIAEPYYRAYEDLQPWRHLRFWYERTSLAPLLADKPAIIPCQGILRGVALFLPDLWRSRKSLYDVEGFDHSSVNHVLGACGDLPHPGEGPILSHSLWQCGQSKELTDSFAIMEFDFTLPLRAVEGSVQGMQEASKCLEMASAVPTPTFADKMLRYFKVPVLTSGLCHGIALWVDWVMDAHQELVISTGPKGGEPTYWKQGIKLLSVPVHLSEGGSSLNISAAFDPSTGDIAVDVDTRVSGG